MDAKLLQKIEELTLYAVAQQKEIQKLKEENQSLKTDILIEIETIKAQLK
jgi:cell division protein FtsB